MPNPVVTVISNVNNVNDESINPIISSSVEIIANSNVNSSESISEENVINEQSTDMKLIMKCNLSILMCTVLLLVVNPAGVIWRKAKSRWTRNLLPASGALSELSSDSEYSVSSGFFAKPLPPSPSRGAKKAPVVKCRLVGTVLFPPSLRWARAVLFLLSRLLVPVVVGPLVYLVGTRCIPLWLLCPPFIFASLSIISININGLRGLDKPSGLPQWLGGLPCTADVVCIQEAHCTSVFECDSWFRSSGFLSSVSPWKTGETRVLVCSARR